MRFNIAHPPTGQQKVVDVDDERRLRHFLDKRLAAEVPGEALGDQYKGYVFKITGGFDKDGFSMKQGVLLPGRVRLLMSEGSSCYKPRRNGERKRKSVRGCIVSNDIQVLNLVIVRKGDEELPGLTDKPEGIPSRLGPKRASKIRRLFALSKADDVRKYVIRRPIAPKPPKEKKEGEGDTAAEHKKKPAAPKSRTRAPKIQRLVTPLTLQRKRHRLAIKKRRSEKNKTEAAAYAKLLSQRAHEARQALKGTPVAEKPAAHAAAPTKKPAADTKKPAAAAKKAADTKKPAAEAKKPAAKAAAKAEGKKAAESKKPAAAAKAEAKTSAPAKPAAKEEAKSAPKAAAKSKAAKK